MILRRTVRFVNRIIDFIILIISLIFILIAAYAVLDSYLVIKLATDDDILKYKPGYESDEPLDREIKGNMVAWITVDDTSVDYPIMQGSDNIAYLNTDPFGEFSLAGSIFLDYRNTEDFTDKYSLVYGHHMERGAMFGCLDEYLKEGYMEEHRKGSLIVKDKTFDLEVFAVLEADANEDAVFNPVGNEEIIPYIKDKALYLDEEKLPKENERLIALSTCKYPETTERTIIFFKF